MRGRCVKHMVEKSLELPDEFVELSPMPTIEYRFNQLIRYLKAKE